MTADAATRAIRKIDPDGSVGLISMEPVPPYDRPPLSKKLWKGQPLEGIWRKTESLGVELHFGRTIRSLDPNEKRATRNFVTTFKIHPGGFYEKRNRFMD